MFTPDKIAFKPLTPDDFPLLTKWLNEPHVHEWYDKDEINTLDEISKRYDFKKIGEPTDGFLVLYDSKPVGYIQKYFTKDWPEFRDATGYNEGVAGVDLFVGDTAFIGKGFGTLMLKTFLKQIVFTDPTVTTCIIDPEPDNKRAIHVYGKAGFRYVRTVKIPEEKDLAYLMELQKEDFDKRS